jgi:N utilization substance protein B
MSTSRSARHRAREFVVQGLYQWHMGGQDEAAIQAQTKTVPGYDKADGAFFRELLHAVLTHADDLRTVLAKHVTRGWDEISPIERGILLLAASELRFNLETPYRVVNGVLDKVAPELRPDEVAQK